MLILFLAFDVTYDDAITYLIEICAINSISLGP